MIIAIYKDDGPANGCGQDAILTAPREEVHAFPTYEDFRHADCALLKSSERKEARYIKWYEAPDIIPRATVAAALPELRAEYEQQVFLIGGINVDYADGVKFALKKLDATIAKLGLTEETE